STYLPDRGVSCAAGAERQPARLHHGEQSLRPWGGGRKHARTSDGAHLRVADVLHGTPQICGIGQRIVIEKIEPLPTTGVRPRVALYGSLHAADEHDLQTVGGIIELPGGIDRRNVCL